MWAVRTEVEMSYIFGPLGVVRFRKLSEGVEVLKEMMTERESRGITRGLLTSGPAETPVLCLSLRILTVKGVRAIKETIATTGSKTEKADFTGIPQILWKLTLTDWAFLKAKSW